MEYNRKLFNPIEFGGEVMADGSVSVSSSTTTDPAYVYTDSMMLALNVALATRRPLLIAGEPGSGKSSIARSIASVLRRTYYERVITSRTQATDLQWTFDAVRRLSDANRTSGDSENLALASYVYPGPLWWAFDPSSAAKARGGLAGIDPGIESGGVSAEAAVLLLDEIDKADPDVPNDLLEPFGAKTFTVTETGERVSAKRDVLLILTTNGERELPPAFLRRCVVTTTDPPRGDWGSWFVQVAEQRLGPEAHPNLYEAVADRIVELREAAKASGLRPPGTAEFLDAIQACLELGVRTDSETFRALTLVTSWKHVEMAIGGGDMDKGTI